MNKNQLKDLILETIQDIAKDSLKVKLKKVIAESIEEIKYEEKDCISGEMDEVNKIIQEINKECELVKGDDGNYALEGKFPHRLHIRPQTQGIYDVLYYKDNTDRTKKLHLSLEQLKDFVKEALKSKELNYVQKEYNKAAKNSEDVVEKTENPIHHKFVKKEVKDTKNDNKDYNELPVKDEDMPEKPMRDATKFKKQTEHPIKGTKPEYTQPKLNKKENKLTLKLKKYTGKARKKD